LKVLVTGGASGIGRATAELLVARDARVMVVDLDSERVATTIAELSVPDRPAPIGSSCDVRNADDCERMAEEAEEKLGMIDALVHCAGILRPPGGRPRPLYELEDREYEAVIGTNLKGTFLVNRAVVRKMLPRKCGQIVNLSSTSGQKGRPLDSLYSASKAGVIGLSESLAEEVRTFGIRVQVILPDAVDTPLWKQNGPLPVAPPGSLPPERVAEVIAMCLSLPPDAICGRLVIEPFRNRKTRGRASRGNVAAGREASSERGTDSIHEAKKTS
jgi:NAD(P)-dependent dehydrogenase (short-subunit alcohol dehydrogenase family)